MQLTLATWNVNSIKSRLHQLLPWLKETAPDVVLLQELKTVGETFPYMEIEELGYNIVLKGQKSYNGVAILSKYPLDDARLELPIDNGVDEEARYVEAVVSVAGKAVRVASVYVPNGQSPDSEKFVYKLAFFKRLYAHMQTLLGYEEMFVLGGDFNVAPYPIDVFDPVRSEGKICYHPLERECIHAILHGGMYDAFRILHPEEQHFSWWDYRTSGYADNQGLRIDYLLLSPMAADRLAHAEILHRMRGQERPSDHAPVICTLEL